MSHPSLYFSLFFYFFSIFLSILISSLISPFLFNMIFSIGLLPPPLLTFLLMGNYPGQCIMNIGSKKSGGYWFFFRITFAFSRLSWKFFQSLQAL